jgi:nucleoside-diphosphate-sugar epimerase
VLASLNLISAFKSAGGTRFVGAGSCAEYDWAHGWLSEAVTPCAPQTPFGRFKNSVFEASMAYAETAALSTAWARIFFLYGPGETPTRLVPHVINSLLSGRFAATSEGWQYRDFLHVDDVAAALVALLGSDVSGAVNIGSGIPVMVRDVVSSIGKLLALPELLQYGAVPMQPGEPPLLVADTRRLREEVGWAPQYGLEDGLAATIIWHKSQRA